MVPAHAMVYLAQKPSTENGQFRVSVLVSAWTQRWDVCRYNKSNQIPNLVILERDGTLITDKGRMARGTPELPHT